MRQTDIILRPWSPHGGTLHRVYANRSGTRENVGYWEYLPTSDGGRENPPVFRWCGDDAIERRVLVAFGIDFSSVWDNLPWMPKRLEHRQEAIVGRRKFEILLPHCGRKAAVPL